MSDENLLDEISLSEPRAPSMELLRELTEEDVVAAAQGLVIPEASAQGQVTRIRYSHHQIARLLVQGKKVIEVAEITGYSPDYISGLGGSPAFKELLAHYDTERDAVFVDTLERMKVLGLHTLEELQQRLSDAPEEWTKRELMELAQLLFGKGQAAAGGALAVGVGLPAAGGVNVSVQFVEAPKRSAERAEGREMKDITPSPTPSPKTEGSLS